MVRGQQDIDMSQVDKSLDDIMKADKSKLKNNQKGFTRGKGRNRGRGRGRGSRTRGKPRVRGRRGRGGGFAQAISMKKSFYARNRGYTGGFGRGNRGRTRFRARGQFRNGRNRSNFRNMNSNANPPPNNAIYQTKTKVIVTNLKLHISSDDIKEIFEKFGTVTQAFVRFDKQTGSSLGVAEIVFSRGSEARQAQKELDGATIDNGVIRVRLPANNRSIRGRGKGRGRGYRNPLNRF